MAGELALNPPGVEVIDGEVVDETAEAVKAVSNRLLATYCAEMAAISVIGIRPFECLGDVADVLSAQTNRSRIHADSERLNELPA